MITVQSGKLTIPEEDRFVGFAGDNLGNSKRFCLPGQSVNSGNYTLCLRFDDDSVTVIPLTKSFSDNTLYLTWSIRREHLLKAGIVMAQLKSVDSNEVVMHSSCDYFIVANSAELADDNSTEYIVREELEERMTAFLEQIRDSAPYIGTDGYWYVYDVGSDGYERSIKAGVTIDSTMIDGSPNAVENGVIKEFVENGLDAKVNKTTTIAALPLSGNIRASDLSANIGAYINPSTIQPGITAGYAGQYGKTYDGKPVMCAANDTWVQLAKAADVYTKTEIDTMIGDLETQLSAI